MVAFDVYAAELLSLKQPPAPIPELLTDDFPDEIGNSCVRDSIKKKMPDYMPDDVPPGAIAIRVPSVSAQVSWLGRRSDYLTMAEADHMSEKRRLDWALFRLDRVGVAREYLQPDLDGFIPFFRVLNGCFPESHNNVARFATAKRLFHIYAERCVKEEYGDAVAAGVKPPKAFEVPDPRTWPAELRQRWDKLFKGIITKYCLKCCKLVKDDTYGSFCSHKCSGMICKKCEAPMQKVNFRREIYDVKRGVQIMSLETALKAKGVKRPLEFLEQLQLYHVGCKGVGFGLFGGTPEPCVDCIQAHNTWLWQIRAFDEYGKESDDFWIGKERALAKLQAMSERKVVTESAWRCAVDCESGDVEHKRRRVV
jgi:hypothetical protein